MDMLKYITMGEEAPGLNLDVPQPFVYRIFAPWLAGILPMDLHTSFYILSSLSLILSALLLFLLLREYAIEARTAFILTFAFIFNRYFFQFTAWDFYQLTDSLSLMIILASILLSLKGKYFKVSLLLFIGVLTKEIVLVVIPFLFAELYYKKSNAKGYLQVGAAVLPSIILFILLRVLIEPQSGNDLMTKLLTEGGANIFTVNSLSKKLLVAFTPFFFLPVFFIKDFFAFIRKNISLSILFLSVFAASLFGGDYERLMTPAVAAYFVFIGTLLQKIFARMKNSKEVKILYYAVAVSSFLSSFYHLWGIIKLPTAFHSVISTIFFGILIGFLFVQAERRFTKKKILS